MIRKIFKFFFGEKTEIQKVEAALRRYRSLLDDMEADFDPTRDCCVDCMTFGQSTKLVEKIKRVEAWLEVLKKRKRK